MRKLVVAAAAIWIAAHGAGAAPRCTIGRMADLPVTMQGRQPMIEAAIEGRPVRLLADSGAFWSTLSPGAAAEFGLSLTHAPFGAYMTGVGGRADISIARLKRFTLAGMDIPNLEFVVGGSEVNGAAGVLGANVLGIRDAEYDLARGVIRLMEHRDCDRGNLAYWADPQDVSTVTLDDPRSTDGHLVGPVTVNGVRLRALFDTGASRSGISLAAAAWAGVHPGDAGVTENGFSHGVGQGMTRTWLAPFASFGVGKEEVRNVRLLIMNVGAPEYDMIVGADFFLSHHIYVSPKLHKLFFTYNGGPVFDLSREAPAPASEVKAALAEPATAAELARRGAAEAARGSVTPALVDLDRAVALAPGEAGILTQRARVRADRKDIAGARADADAALALKPNDPDALLLRAMLRWQARDVDGARSDAAHLSDGVSPQADVRLALAHLYTSLEEPASAIPQFSLWIAIHQADSRMTSALNGRCWARALAGRELSEALADCNAAAARTRNEAGVLDSRGLVELRMGKVDAALADYARALAADPKLAWSRYGRGLARIAKGDRAGGEADLAAAAAIDPDLPARARRYGIVPAG